MQLTITEQLAAVRAELEAAGKEQAEIAQRYQAALSAAQDTSGEVELNELRAQRTALLADLFMAGAEPSADKRLIELDEQIQAAETANKSARDRAEGARIVSEQLAKQIRDVSPAIDELRRRYQALSLDTMRAELAKLGDAYKAACDQAAQAYAELQAATRIQISLAMSLGQGALGNLMAPSRLEFFAPAVTPSGCYTVETHQQINLALITTREAWNKAGLFVPAN